MSIFANRFDSTEHNSQPYVAALLELVADRDPLALLPALVPRIDVLMRELTAEQLAQPEAPGKWSMATVIHHLADAELFYSVRYRLILAHDEPALAGYDQDAFAARLHYDALDAGESREQLAVTRRANVRLLSLLSPEERQRSGIHSERGRESVERLMKLHAAHDLVHLRQLERIRNR